MKILLIMYVALVVLALSGCKSKTETQAIVPPISGNCVTSQVGCQSGIYNTPGYTPYMYNGGYNNGYNSGYGYTNSYQYGGGYSNGPFYYMNNSAYLCNCGPGYVPTYNTYAGLGCVQSSNIGSSHYAYYSWGANNNQWTNIPQISNQNSGCYNGVVQSCLVDQPSTCAVGFTCRADSASSRLGLCRANSAQGTGTYGPVIR